jgi:hypothetical protein
MKKRMLIVLALCLWTGLLFDIVIREYDSKFEEEALLLRHVLLLGVLLYLLQKLWIACKNLTTYILAYVTSLVIIPCCVYFLREEFWMVRDKLISIFRYTQFTIMKQTRFLNTTKTNSILNLLVLTLSF